MPTDTPTVRFPLAGRWIWILPALVAVAVHLPVLWCGFAWDDVSLIALHPHIRDPGFLLALFQNDYGVEFGDRLATGYYRPGFMFLVTLLHRAAGATPVVYHLFSLAVFALTTVCLVRLCRRHAPGAGPWFPLVAGLLYAVHPARTEVVSFVMSLPDLLVELGGVLAMALLLRDAAVTTAGAVGRVALLGLLAFGVAITKESGFLVIAALGGTALAAGVFHRPRLRSAAGLALGMAAGLGAAALLRSTANVAPLPVGQALCQLWGEGAGPALHSAWYAMRDLVIPQPAVFLCWESAGGFCLSRVGILAVVAGFGVAVVAALWRNQRFVALAAAWFGVSVLNLMLVSAVLQSYDQRYFAVAPAMLLLALAAGALWPRTDAGAEARGRERRLLAAAVVMYLALFAAFTLTSSVQCRDDRSFFRAMADDYPREVYPRVALANTLFYCHGDLKGAERAALEAIRLRPDVKRVRALGKVLAACRLVQGRPRESLPWLAWAEAALPDDVELHHLRGMVLRALNEPAAAARSFERALELDPANEACRRQLEACRTAAATGTNVTVKGP